MIEPERIESDIVEPVRRRGIYLLPNLFTTGGLFAGFYAIVSGMKGHFIGYDLFWSSTCFSQL